MKSCRKIVSVSYVADDGFTSVAIPSEQVISVSSLLHTEDKTKITTFLSVVERSLVQDFTEYYDKFDFESGISYAKISKSNVTFDDDSSVVYSGSEVQNTCRDNFFCVRQLGLGSIRSFEVGLQDAKFSGLVGKDMTDVSMVMEPHSWVYLEKIVNMALDWNFVTVRTTDMTLTFNYSGDEVKDEMAKAIYLLLSEIVCFCTAGEPVTVLISELPKSVDLHSRLISTLAYLKSNCQIFIP